MKIIHIEEEVFGTNVLILGDCSVEEANKHLVKIKNKYLIEEDENMAGRLVKQNDNVYRILFLRDLSEENFPKLVHEIFHLVVRICDDKGVPIIPNIQTGQVGDETAAYLMEFYISKVKGRIIRNKSLNKMKPTTKPVKKPVKKSK